MGLIDELNRRRPAGLDRAGYDVLRAVGAHADYRTLQTRARQDTIAGHADLSTGHCRRILGRLARDGWITVERRDRRMGNVTTIVRARLEDALARFIDVPPERASRAVGARVDARSERAPARAPRVPQEILSLDPAAARVEQLALALLGAREDQDQNHLTRPALADARRHAALLPDGATPEEVHACRRDWQRVGRDPANATPAALAKWWPTWASTRTRNARSQNATPGVSCEVCDGMRLTVDDDGRARPCRACAARVS